MYSLYPLFSCLFLLPAAVSSAAVGHTYPNISSCTGGTIYFAAHPADTLLYQNPDLFHDLYVYKCVTTVIFTSRNRGIEGNLSRLLEYGVDAAYSWMTSIHTDNQTWVASTIQVGDGNVIFSKPQGLENVQMIYLRLPDGGPLASGYANNKGESLRKLYMGKIKTMTTADKHTTYTLDSREDTIAAIFCETRAAEVRVLDYKTGIPNEEDEREDRADHVVNARLVVDVLRQIGSTARVPGYAGSFARKFNANLNETDLDFKRKMATFLTYAEHDEHMLRPRQEACKTYDECMRNADDDAKHTLFPGHDVLYVAEALEREYYVS